MKAAFPMPEVDMHHPLWWGITDFLNVCVFKSINGEIYLLLSRIWNHGKQKYGLLELGDTLGPGN